MGGFPINTLCSHGNGKTMKKGGCCVLSTSTCDSHDMKQTYSSIYNHCQECVRASCGTVALVVLGQFSDICGPQISENWPRTIKDYGSAAMCVLTSASMIVYLFFTRS